MFAVGLVLVNNRDGDVTELCDCKAAARHCGQMTEFTWEYRECSAWSDTAIAIATATGPALLGGKGTGPVGLLPRI